MIEVLIGSNTNRNTIIVDANRTVKDVLEENHINYSTGGIFLDGMAISGGDLSKTFAEHGIKDKCSLISVVKADGGK